MQVCEVKGVPSEHVWLRITARHKGSGLKRHGCLNPVKLNVRPPRSYPAFPKMQACVSVHRPLLHTLTCTISAASSKRVPICVENFTLLEEQQQKRNLMAEGNTLANAAEGAVLSSQWNEISPSCESEVTVIFPLSGADRRWCCRPHTMASVAAHISLSPP